MEAVVESHIDEAKAELIRKMPNLLEVIALDAESNAIDEVDRLVYDQPESKSGYIRTGRLRNSITHATDDSAAYVGTNLEYAPYVELGTSKMAERPFLKNAVVNHMDQYNQIIEDALRT